MRLLLAAFLLTPIPCTAQELVPESSASPTLVAELSALDAKLFEAAFVTCDTELIRDLVTDDFEFYHDRSGIIAASGDAFEADAEQDCARRDSGEIDRLRRELLPESVTAHALGEEGAMQMGTHRFHIIRDGQPDQFIEEAKFIHVWRRVDGTWLIAREISYDHMAVVND